jgi:ATP-dependent exoDNAse (exonuclease V) alpha subunit
VPDPFGHGFGDALFGLNIIQPEGYTQSGRQHSSRDRSIPLGYAEAKVGEYPFGELDALVPAYATTIHKSQGSEYPAVVITLATQHYTMLARNLVYTAVTRGKRLVVIVGQRKALAIAVRTHGSKRRWTKLREWLSARSPNPAR